VRLAIGLGILDVAVFGAIGTSISLSSSTIVEDSSDGAVLGTAAIVGAYTGTPSWSLVDGTGTFEINSSTGVVTVLSNTDLVHATHPTIPIAISVSGVTPALATSDVNVTVTPAAAGFSASLQFNDTGASGGGDRNSMYLPLI
jgi:hypothetical protein